VSISGFCAPEELDELELELLLLELELLLLEDELLDELEELLELEEELDEPLEFLLPPSPPPQPVKRRQSNETAQPNVRRERSMIHNNAKTSA